MQGHKTMKPLGFKNPNRLLNPNDVECSFFVSRPVFKWQVQNAQFSDEELKSEYFPQTKSRFAAIFAKTIT